jgi:hypothetical protein
MARSQRELLTTGEPITVTFSDGRSVFGTLWMNPSQRGQWEIEYEGQRKSDNRTYQNAADIRVAARALLRQLGRQPAYGQK